MTTAAHRWSRAVVIALVAALVVLVHHETAAAVPHAAPVRASAGTTTPLPAHDADGACSGAAMQHCCSAAGVDSPQLAPPHLSVRGCPAVVHAGAAGGRDVPGTTGRAPPDLSLLSRLLL